MLTAGRRAREDRPSRAQGDRVPSGTFCSMRNQMGRRVHFLWHCAHARAQTRLGTRGHPSATARVKTWTVRRRTGRGRRLPAGGAVSMGQRRGRSAGALLPHLTPQPCVYFAHGTLRTGKGTPSRPEAESDKRPRPPWNQAGGAAPEGARPGAWTPRPAGPAAAGCACAREQWGPSFAALEVCAEAEAEHGPLPDTAGCSGPRRRALRPVGLGHGTPVS